MAERKDKKKKKKRQGKMATTSFIGGALPLITTKLKIGSDADGKGRKKDKKKKPKNHGPV